MGSKSHRCSRCPPAITYYDPGFWLWCGRQWRIGPVGTSTNRYPIYCAPDRAGTDHYPYGTCPRNRRRHCGTATTTALLGTSATHPFSQTPRLSDQNRHRSTLGLDRKSTRLNSSHVAISYAVFCLKKKIIHGHLTAAMYEAPEDII